MEGYREGMNYRGTELLDNRKENLVHSVSPAWFCFALQDSVSVRTGCVGHRL